MGAITSRSRMKGEHACNDDGTCLNKAGHYRRDWLKDRWSGTDRDRYRYKVDYAITGRAVCKACNKTIREGQMRVGRSSPNPFDSEGGTSDFTQYFHARAQCAAMTFLNSRCTTHVPIQPGQITGVAKLRPADQKVIRDLIKDLAIERKRKCTPSSRK